MLLTGLAHAELQNIIFVCGGNTGRSPMAASLANEKYHFEKNGYRALSRGVNVNSAELMPEPNAIIVMDEQGIDLRAHRAKPITVADIGSAALILAMARAHQEKLLTLSPASASKIKLLSEYATGLSQDVEDAHGQDLDFYRSTRDQIDRYIEYIQNSHFNTGIKN